MASGTLKLSGRPTLTRALHKDGRRLYIEMSFALVKNADGSSVGSSGRCARCGACACCRATIRAALSPAIAVQSPDATVRASMR